MFQIGDLVSPSSEYPSSIGRRRRREGEVVSVKRFIGVRWKGMATIERLAPKFIRPLPRLGRQKLLDEIDAAATALYDELNPEWEKTINVSKCKCIRRVMKKAGIPYRSLFGEPH